MAGNDKTTGSPRKASGSTGSASRKSAPNSTNTGKSSTAGKPSTAKTATPARHSAPTRKPVTIDAEATSVSSTASAAAKAPAAEAKVAPATAAKTAPDIPRPPMPSASATTSASSSATSVPKPDIKPTPASRPVSPTPAASAKAPSSSVGILPLATAALLGGVIAIGGAWLLGILGNQSQEAALAARVEQTQFDTVRTELDTRLAAIEQRPAGPILDQSAIEAAIDARLAEVTEGVTASGPDAELLTSLQASLAAATGRLETLEGAESARATRLDQIDAAISSGSAGETAGLAAITTQSASQAEEIAALQEEVGVLSETIVNGIDGSMLETLRGELATANQAVSDVVSDVAQSTSGAIDELRGQIDATGERIAALDTRITDASATAQSAAQASQQGVSELRERIAAVQSEIDARIAEQSAAGAEQIATLTDRLDNGADKIAARALAAAALKRDIDQGTPFASSLATLKSVAPEPASLDALDPYAENGVPRIATLRAQFDEVADAILAATSPEPADTGIADRLFAGARSLVKVRSLAAVEGDDPAARVTQIAGQLDAGRLEEASAIWDKLPEAGRVASAGWHDALTARILAERLVADTVDNFLQQSGASPAGAAPAEQPPAAPKEG